LRLLARDGRLAGVEILAEDDAGRHSERAVAPAADGPSGTVLRRAGRELTAYFSGRRRSFTIPLDLSGLPPFTARVLEVLRTVPYGATVTYGELAARAGSPRAARAVGRAVAANPLAIVIPCHRVVAAGGRPGGYSGGGGLATKQWLLTREGTSTEEIQRIFRKKLLDRGTGIC
jgi:methylated-DNA-[protein]-cysteine S-methyltransferase